MSTSYIYDFVLDFIAEAEEKKVREVEGDPRADKIVTALHRVLGVDGETIVDVLGAGSFGTA